MLGFVEVPRRRRWNPDGDEFSRISLFWIGITIFLGFTSAMLPFGAYLSLRHALWALVVLFVPILLLGLFLLPRFGTMILLSIFLSLVGGGVSILFLGDFFGYVTGMTAAHNLRPEEAVKFPGVKYLFLRDFELDINRGGEFASPMVYNAGARANYGPLLYYRYAPIRSKSLPDSEIPLYAVCFSQTREPCSFDLKGRGGSLLQESLWEQGKVQFAGIPPAEKGIFLIWRPDLPGSLIAKGLWSLVALVFLQGIWVFTIFFPRWEENPRP